MIEVVVALEEHLLRLGTKAALDEAEDCTVVGMVDRVDAIEEEVRRSSPKVLIMDAEFQREDRQVIPRMVAEHPELKVLVVVEHSGEECSIRSLLADPKAAGFSEEALEHLDECCLTSLRSSAKGCIPRTSEPGQLLHAVRTVAAGEIAAAPWLTAILNPGGSTPRVGAPAPISARELEVIGLVADGKGNKEIGKLLGIREQTVKNHLASIMQKLGVRSRLEVGIQAVRQNLSSQESPQDWGNSAQEGCAAHPSSSTPSMALHPYTTGSFESHPSLFPLWGGDGGFLAYPGPAAPPQGRRTGPWPGG